MEKKWKGGKGHDNRAAFNVGIKYNSILDDDDDDDEFPNSTESATDFDFLLDDSNSSVTNCNTSFTSKLREGTSIVKSPPPKRRRILKKTKKGTGSPTQSCINTNVLPTSFQSVFPFKEFNKMQSRAFPKLYQTDKNCVISSPTGSGKTVLFELAILRMLKERPANAVESIKILYMAPTKSLCSERLRSWGSNFLNLTVGMLTSDTSYMEAEKVRKCNIIITTPEKWDLLTRKWRDYNRPLELVTLILVDEIHTLRERRGATLEVVLTRMNLMCKNIRIIALSATIPNIEDISVWLKSSSNQEEAEILEFDDSYRPVSLQKIVCGYTFYNKNDFLYDGLYNSKLGEVLRIHSKSRSVLIFCPTRASTVSTAKYVAQNCVDLFNGPCQQVKEQLHDPSLSECCSQGVAFHHAGLSIEDRTKVELGFLEGRIKIMCSTSTLAVGVNLPAYLVIIKGTKTWNSSVVQEYSILDILQMIGRAGRPNFEKEGCAIIMTESKMKKTYEKMLHGKESLESSLHLELVEHLASEVSLGTITSVNMAVNWLRNTFLYVRFCKNPNAYDKIRRFMKHSDVRDSQVGQFCESVLKDLQRNQIIQEQNGSLSCTQYGQSMVHHYVLFDSLKIFITSRKSQSVGEILQLLSSSKEFTDIRVRHNEKRLYKEINCSPLIMFPFLTERKQSQSIHTALQKVSLLIQYELSGLEFPSYPGASKLHQTLLQDKALVFRHCCRILNCMVDAFTVKGDGISLKNALFLFRSINSNCWEDSPMVLRQLKSVSLFSVNKLIHHGVRNLEQIRRISDQQMENYLGQERGSGSKIKGELDLLPQLHIQCKLEYFSERNQYVEIVLKVELSAQFVTPRWNDKDLSFDMEALKTTGELLDFKRMKLAYLSCPRNFTIMALMMPHSEGIEINVNCHEIAGIGKNVQFSTYDLPQRSFKGASDGKSRETVLDRCLIRSDSEAEFDGSSLSSDDCIFQYLNERPSGCDLRKENVPDSRRQRPNGNFECNHTCKDKMHCRHLCCKEGIPGDSLRSKKMTSLPQRVLPSKQSDEIGLTDNIRRNHDCTSPQGVNYITSNPETSDVSAPLSHVLSAQNPGNLPTSINVDTLNPDAVVSQSSDSILSDYNEIDNEKLYFLGSDVDFD